MANYAFLDAYGSVLTAASNDVGGAQQPIVIVSSIIGNVNATLAGNASISGTVGASILGTVPVTQAGPFIASVSGTVGAQQIGAWTTSVVGTLSTNPSSVSGVGVFNVNVVGSGSVLSIPTGSTIALLQAASIAGTYTEDSAHATNDRGLFTLKVRNDSLASITSANGDYSGGAVGPVGEAIVANAPLNSWWQAQTSVMYGTSVQALAPQGASVFTYVTGIQVANDSGTFSRVKFTGGLGSVLAWTVAPANGGSNIVFTNPIKTGENSGFSASISGVSSIYISAQGFTSRT